MSTATDDMYETVKEINREIAARPIEKPGPGQTIGECYYSRTGWAIYESNGACTCRPATAPVPAEIGRE